MDGFQFAALRGIRIFLSIFVAATLAGCFHNDDDPPPQPPEDDVALAISITATKTLHFEWTGGEGADDFKLLENPDGASGFTQIGANFNTGTSNFDQEIAVHLLDWVNAGYKVEACNTTGCVESDEVALTSVVIEQAIGYIKASNTEAADLFGARVALSRDGGTLVVSATEDSNATGINGNQADNTFGDAGAVYVYTRTGTSWSQEAYIKASNTEADDKFGSTVALSDNGNTLAVSAFTEDSNATGINGNQADNTFGDAGAVYVYTRTGTSWSQEAYIKASNTDANDLFGVAVTLSGDGNTLAVGAIFEDSNATDINGNQADNTFGNAGAVYVYTRTGTTWSQEAYIKASNTDAGDRFGFAAALSDDGNTLAVGASGEGSATTGVGGNQADNTALGAGAVYVFTRSGTVWTQQAYIKASNTDNDDNFGESVTLANNGNRLAVGTSLEDSSAIGIDGNQADNAAVDSGAVYVFSRNTATWTQEAYLKASSTEASDRFGAAVAFNSAGDVLGIGALFEDSAATGINGDQSGNSAGDAGAAYIFKRDANGTWNQQSYVKASNTGAGDSFASRLALDGSGNLLVVGGSQEDSNATGINGDQSDDSVTDAGAAYIY